MIQFFVKLLKAVGFSGLFEKGNVSNTGKPANETLIEWAEDRGLPTYSMSFNDVIDTVGDRKVFDYISNDMDVSLTVQLRLANVETASFNDWIIAELSKHGISASSFRTNVGQSGIPGHMIRIYAFHNEKDRIKFRELLNNIPEPDYRKRQRRPRDNRDMGDGI